MICPVCRSKTELSKLNVNNLSDKIRKHFSVGEKEDSWPDDVINTALFGSEEAAKAAWRRYTNKIRYVDGIVSELPKILSRYSDVMHDEETMGKFRMITSMDNEETEPSAEESKTSKGYLGEAPQLVRSGYGRYSFEGLKDESERIIEFQSGDEDIKMQRRMKETSEKLKKEKSKKRSKGDSD
jgi:hypothetical protein